jgi:hypothetical protein
VGSRGEGEEGTERS